MLKLCYNTTFGYTHRIENEPLLKDNACQENHSHENVKLVVKLKIVEEKHQRPFYDFKLIKEAVEETIMQLHNKNITDEFDIYTTEDLIIWIRDDLLISLKVKFPTSGFHESMLELELQETPKYGLELASH